MISIGVSQTQMSYSGYGDSRPIAENNTEEGLSLIHI